MATPVRDRHSCQSVRFKGDVQKTGAKERRIASRFQGAGELLFSFEFQESGPRFIVSRLVSGGDLLRNVTEAYNRGEWMPRESVEEAFRQAITGLAVLHVNDIVHSDTIKPRI
jgi:serine/threonine protein kinase